MKNKYSIQYTTRFKKQYKKVISNSKYKEEDFRKVVTMLANDDVLSENTIITY